MSNNYLDAEILEALQEACRKSKRKGAWSTPSEVTANTRDETPSAKTLIKLAKKKVIERKGSVLYRPKSGGGGGNGEGVPLRGTPGPGDYTPPDGRDQGGQDGYPQDKYPDKTDRPTDDSPRKDPRDTTGDAVGTAIGAMIMGGGLSSATGAAGGQTPLYR